MGRLMVSHWMVHHERGHKFNIPAHVLAGLRQTVPLAKTMAEKVTEQRNWAVGRTRNAGVARSS
jgi:hypothetical protein